jgi:hypothetical protein
LPYSAETGYVAPFGRWAATSRDPSPQDILVAEMAQSGKYNTDVGNPDDQAAAAIYSASRIIDTAKRGNYWIGPVPGVDHQKVFAFSQLAVPWDSAQGQQLIKRGQTALKTRAPDWKNVAPCSIFVATSPRVAGTLLVAGLLAVAGAIGYGVSV